MTDPLLETLQAITNVWKEKIAFAERELKKVPDDTRKSYLHGYIDALKKCVEHLGTPLGTDPEKPHLTEDN